MHHSARAWIAKLAFVAALTFLGACASIAPGHVTRRAPVEFVVIAPASFQPTLDRYLKYRSKNVALEFVALENVLAGSPGVDDPEKVKRYLYDLYTNRGLRYALLAGDADVFPVRYMCLDRVTKEAFDYAFYPSDLYYADLAKRDGSFDDWNATKTDFHASYFGEVRGENNKNDPINYDAVDYIPEVAVGRWPVSNIVELDRVITKTIAYENAVFTKNTATRRAVFVTVQGWVDCRAWIDTLAASLPADWTSSLLYEGKTLPSAANVTTELTKGAGLVVHAGHGHDHGWEGSLQTGDIVNFNNAEAPPIVLSAGCSTARFATLPPYESYMDTNGAAHKGTNHGEVFTIPPPAPACYATGDYNKTGFGEQLLKGGSNGAVAYFGCNTGSQPAGLTLVEGFLDKLKIADPNRTLRLGDLYTHSIHYFFDKQQLQSLKPSPSWYPPSIFFQGMKFMLFGDPMLQIH
ncbi:MAG: C25 family cysteine peptidase [Planctomycetota bacterium]